MAVITQEHLDLAKKLGACRWSSYRVGQSIGEVPAEDLEWMERRAPKAAIALVAQCCEEIGLVACAAMPLAIFGSGYGDGVGYGCYGSGYGSGYGDGSGYGGYGYGDGYGSGSGYGGSSQIVIEA